MSAGGVPGACIPDVCLGLLSAGMQHIWNSGNTSHTAYLQPFLALLPEPRHPALCRQVWDISSAKCLQDNALYKALYGEKGQLLYSRPLVSKLSALVTGSTVSCRTLLVAGCQHMPAQGSSLAEPALQNGLATTHSHDTTRTKLFNRALPYEA